MTKFTRTEITRIASRALGAERAQSLAAQLPEHVDTDDPRDAAKLERLGLTRDQLISDLGGEL